MDIVDKWMLYVFVPAATLATVYVGFRMVVAAIRDLARVVAANATSLIEAIEQLAEAISEKEVR